MTVRARSSASAVAAALLLFAAVPAAAGDCTVSDPGWDDPALHMRVAKIGREQMLLIEGRIGPDLPARLGTILAGHPAISEIRFNSSGGDAASAMEAGRLIRSKGGFATHVSAGSGCVDACALLFLSGAIRSVDPDGVFDIGRFYEGQGSAASAGAASRQSLRVVDYLIFMGVSRRLLTGTLDREDAADGDGTSPRRCLTPEELHRYNVANWNE